MVRPAKYIGSEMTTLDASRYRARASRPSARNKVASRLLIDRAATPPLRGGEYSLAQSTNSGNNNQTTENSLSAGLDP